MTPPTSSYKNSACNQQKLNRSWATIGARECFCFDCVLWFGSPVKTTLIFALTFLFSLFAQWVSAIDETRPNILWISCEDISPNLGCYGDSYARTPNLDALAKQGVRFDRAFTHSGVCAILRSGVITGVYPVSIGSQHMRSRIVTPPHIKCFPEYLRGVGYYCTNRSKTDYQFEPPFTAWDRQGNKHNDWRGRADDQPFFSVINLTVCHESQIRHGEERHAQIKKKLAANQIHDPDQAAETLPPYIPNTPEARKNWAWYHDNISEMDRQVGQILQKLEDDGLAENTLVVFWSDHGQGMPRGKRWIYDSGTHVPVIMRWPGKLEKQSVRKDIVTLIDLTATTLSVAGVEPPEYTHGRVLIGEKKEPEPDYVFAHRDRMDESYELQRSARSRNFRYIRNYEPEKTYAQGIEYMDKMPAMKQWRRLHAEGKLTAAQGHWFAKPKPIEELYDCENDPHNVHNLANDPNHASTLSKMRKATEDWQIDVGDLGMISEPVLMERIEKLRVKVAAPELRVEASDDGLRIVAASATEGASITYRSQANGTWSPWILYSEANRQLQIGSDLIEVKACRIGCKDSATVRKKIN